MKRGLKVSLSADEIDRFINALTRWKEDWKTSPSIKIWLTTTLPSRWKEDWKFGNWFFIFVLPHKFSMKRGLKAYTTEPRLVNLRVLLDEKRIERARGNAFRHSTFLQNSMKRGLKVLANSVLRSWSLISFSMKRGLKGRRSWEFGRFTTSTARWKEDWK